MVERMIQLPLIVPSQTVTGVVPIVVAVQLRPPLCISLPEHT